VASPSRPSISLLHSLNADVSILVWHVVLSYFKKLYFILIVSAAFSFFFFLNAAPDGRFGSISDYKPVTPVCGNAK